MIRLADRLSKLFGAGRRDRSRAGRRLACEALEPRELLSGLGTDYTLMGGRWDNSRTITYSIAPDGVPWDQGTNNVNATLDADYGGTGWQSLVAQAFQTWAAATNLNFQQVADSPSAFNTSGVNQGDPSFGDIRIGGYNFGTNATIARTYGPPPNGQTGAGDVELNTAFNFGPGSQRDLETVLIHEIGHSLGLGESPQASSVMYSYYAGVRHSLSGYDIEGIQSIYGARSSDAYQSYGTAVSPSTALDLTPVIDPTEQGQLGGLSLSTLGDVEYFSVVAPPLVGSTLSIAAIAQGSSLLSPEILVIDPSTGALLAADAHPNASGDIAMASVPAVQAGHRYVIAVAGATNDVFSVGSYRLQFGFFGGTRVSTSPAIPADPFAYDNTFETATELGSDDQPTSGNLTLPSAANYQVFAFETTRPGAVFVYAAGANAIVVDSSARDVAWGTGLLGFMSPTGGRYFLILFAPSPAPVSHYAFAVRTPVAGPPVAALSVATPTPNVVQVGTVATPTIASSPVVINAITPAAPARRPGRPIQ